MKGTNKEKMANKQLKGAKNKRKLCAKLKRWKGERRMVRVKGHFTLESWKNID